MNPCLRPVGRVIATLSRWALSYPLGMILCFRDGALSQAPNWAWSQPAGIFNSGLISVEA
jgi:hypothetical protein